jgi:hypothetical protein
MDTTSAVWRTSSYSGGNGGQCIQVAAIPSSPDGPGALCVVRDSRDPAGSALVFGSRQWRAFAAVIKASMPARPESCPLRGRL